MYAEFIKEVEHEIKKDNHDLISNSNLETILKISENKKIRKFLMKNKEIAFYIQSPLFTLYKKGDINFKEYSSALTYQSAVLKSKSINYAKQNLNCYGISGKTGENCVFDKRIKATRRVDTINKEIVLKSSYNLIIRSGKTKTITKDYLLLANLFFFHELYISDIAKILKKKHATIKKDLKIIIEIITENI